MSRPIGTGSDGKIDATFSKQPDQPLGACKRSARIRPGVDRGIDSFFSTYGKDDRGLLKEYWPKPVRSFVCSICEALKDVDADTTILSALGTSAERLDIIFDECSMTTRHYLRVDFKREICKLLRSIRNRNFKFNLRPSSRPSQLVDSWPDDLITVEDLSLSVADCSLRPDVASYLDNLMKSQGIESYILGFDISQLKPLEMSWSHLK
jgi:hypothetical protein